MNHGCMAMRLKPKPNHPNNRAKTGKSTSNSVKCKGFAYCFLRLQWRGATWILATRSYRNTVNKECYLQAIRQKRIELWKTQSWILHHDNVLANTSLLVREFLAKTKTVIMPQSPYSSNLDPRWLFSSFQRRWTHRWKESVLLRLRK